MKNLVFEPALTVGLSENFTADTSALGAAGSVTKNVAVATTEDLKEMILTFHLPRLSTVSSPTNEVWLRGILNEKLCGSDVMSLTWRAFPLGSIQTTRRRAAVPPVAAAVAQTVLPRTKEVFG